ncbi:MAG: sigma-E processing peptidase SpoIIGA [Oscillospiraceae bacterium]|nr:sigma-E processing peptidase SpoIIGA [Oscillospiraceae bacterium]
MTEIYLDVLIGLNLYITWALLDCCELLGHLRAKRGRKGLASVLGGISSLMILLPELSAFPLMVLRFLLAAVLTYTAFGSCSGKRFLRTMLLFFLVSCLFAGIMIACWLVFTPSGMAIRNGVVYFHLSALTLILSTVAASLAARGLSVLFFRGKPEKLIETVTLAVDGRETELKVFLDTGNRLFHCGMPVMVCSEKALRRLIPAELTASASDLFPMTALSGRWKRRIRMVLCETAAGKKLLTAFLPDHVRRRDNSEIRCLVALTDNSFCGGEADAAAPPELWQQNIG